MCALVRTCASEKRRMVGQTHMVSESDGKESEFILMLEGLKGKKQNIRHKKMRAAV